MSLMIGEEGSGSAYLRINSVKAFTRYCIRDPRKQRQKYHYIRDHF